MSDYRDTAGFDRPAERRVKIVHLVFGLIYLGIVGVWVLGTSGAVDWGDSVRYLAPIVLVVAGGLGLAAALVPNARRRGTDTGTHPSSDFERNL